jgi:hypothetical protein
VLSNQVFFLNAATTPKITPITQANKIEENAKTIVCGMALLNMTLTRSPV